MASVREATFARPPPYTASRTVGQSEPPSAAKTALASLPVGGAPMASAARSRRLRASRPIQ